MIHTKIVIWHLVVWQNCFFGQFLHSRLAQDELNTVLLKRGHAVVKSKVCISMCIVCILALFRRIHNCIKKSLLPIYCLQYCILWRVCYTMWWNIFSLISLFSVLTTFIFSCFVNIWIWPIAKWHWKQFDVLICAKTQ